MLRFVTWMKHESIISTQNPNSSLNNRSTQRLFHQLGRLWPRFFFFVFFLWWYSYGRLYPKGLMEHIVLHFLGSSEKILWSSALGNSVKVCCFTRTILKRTPLSLIWLPSMTAALNWFNFPLLAWSRSIRLPFIPGWKGSFLVPVFGRWWLHICSGALSGQ